jgi:hypothetical protein
MSALELALFIASGGGTASATPATATAKGSFRGVKAWSKMSKLAKAKYLWKLTHDPVLAGKRLALAMGRVEKVSDKVSRMSKAIKFFTGTVIVREITKFITTFVKQVKQVLKFVWDKLKGFFVMIWKNIKHAGKTNLQNLNNKLYENINKFMTKIYDKASDFKKYVDDAKEMAESYRDEVFEYFGENPKKYVLNNINKARRIFTSIRLNIERTVTATGDNPLDFLPDEDVQEDISLNDQQPLKQFSQEEASQFAEGLAFLYPEKNESMALAFVYGDMNLLYAMYNTTSIAEESDREVYEEFEISYPTDETLDETENSTHLDDYFALTSEGTKYVSRMNNAWNDYKRWDSSLTDEDKNKWALDKYKAAIKVLRKSGKVDQTSLQEAETLQTTTSPVDVMRNVLSVISMLDPSGITSNMAAYMYPNCCTYFITAGYDACSLLGKGYDKKLERQEERLEKKEKRALARQEKKAGRQEKKEKRKQERVDNRISKLTSKGKLDKIEKIRERRLKKANRKADKAINKLEKDLKKSEKKEERHQKKIDRKEKNEAKKQLKQNKIDKRRAAKDTKVQARKDEKGKAKQTRLNKKFQKKNTKLEAKSKKKKEKEGKKEKKK